MSSKNARVGEAKSEVIRQLPKACSDEAAAVEFMEAQRWADEPACPHCGGVDVYMMKDRDGNRNARFLWRCRDCAKQYTVRVGTIMEDSPIPLRHWCYAFWAACAGKKGVSALQIQRMTGLSYKSALFMMHRIRWAMVEANGEPLTGTVECDETYVGGKPRDGRDPKPRPRGRGRGRHTPVVAAIQRDTGTVRTRVVANVTAANLRSVLEDYVHPSAEIHTDELKAYKSATAGFADHKSVKHADGEYARDGVHCNNAESFFSRLKRSVFGIHHKVSREHLHRYVTHMEFLHNTRKLDDGERIGQAIRMAEGKRLTYRMA